MIGSPEPLRHFLIRIERQLISICRTFLFLPDLSLPFPTYLFWRFNVQAGEPVDFVPGDPQFDRFLALVEDNPDDSEFHSNISTNMIISI